MSPDERLVRRLAREIETAIRRRCMTLMLAMRHMLHHMSPGRCRPQEEWPRRLGSAPVPSPAPM